MILMEGFFCLRKRPTPARVPPVPVWTHPPSRQGWDWDEEEGGSAGGGGGDGTEQVKASTLCCVWNQISGPVVEKWP